jgi:Asp/Glu/hydantoin racemase
LAHHPAVAEDAFGVPVIEPSQAAQAILAAVAERRQLCIRPQNNQSCISLVA